MRRLAACIACLAACGALAQDLRLPFDGRWFVLQGGDTINVNHHMAVQAQWYGVDFGKVGGPGGRALSTPHPSRPEDFYAWNAQVLSPIDGDVVSVVNDRPDNALGTKDAEHPRGNHVVIEAAPGRYVVLAHFRRHGITVAHGDRVVRGQSLGRCGNSGNSDFPHVHLHVQDAREPSDARGVNPVFSQIDVELTGKAFDGVTWPLIRGLFVSPAP